MKIAIVGAGALGLYYGALLQRAGEDVHFLLRRDFEAIVRNGLNVFSTDGDFALPRVKGYRTPDEIGPADLVLVGLKTFANDRYEELIRPLVGAETRILTLQNGLGNEEALAALFGPERVIGGVAFLCSNRGEPGEVHHLGAGRITLGDFLPRDREWTEALAVLFVRAGVECRATGDLKRARWEKLVWNIPFNGLCALLQQPVNLLLARDASRTLVREIMHEVIAAANAQGLTVPIAPAYADSMLEFTDRMGEYKPSMQIDREEGRPLEIGAIFRTPLAYGSQRGIAMPRVEMLATLLEQSAG
ncbi:putative 2-dehydropantoate 2-reductase [Geobacter anodireducens]|uniref:2-dehydropantoate 2-reductase n=1 Tax=Geobacter soli TaxID=1510391 RepID=A0A0C1TKZ4_9BACT|nr:putative 2-dehydropantoate 2-reductase [Geobacter soli]KIE41474.1 2-dehydropantoate 2-reductase [Geobacter soli]